MTISSLEPTGGTPVVDPSRTYSSVSDAEAVRILEHANSGIRPMEGRLAYRFIKRVFDIVASGLAILVLLIPSLILSVVICVKSPGAGPLYAQTRVGRVHTDGSFTLFRMYKFRSMVPHADKMVADLKHKNDADGPLFKMKNDPRIIPGVGTWIRKHSIDELPQLINVFIGNMSLIGPRPALPNEVVKYDERAMKRLAVKSGCGGAWQAGERSDSTFGAMVSLDLNYIKHCSIGYDLQLVLGTVKSMIVGDGAY